MYRDILVPLDGSTFGEHALPLAVTIAKRAGARLQLMHVHPPLEAAYTEFPLFDINWETRVRSQEKDYLETTAKLVRTAAPSIDVATVHKDGYIAGALRDYATFSTIDLVVLTTHARGAMGRFWLGAVADDLVRTLPMPLLLVRPTETEPDVRQERPLRNIVLPLDGSPLAELMIEPAVTLGRVFEAKFHLVRVVKPILSAVVPMGLGTLTDVAAHLAQDISAAQNKILADAKDYLDRTAATIASFGVHVETYVESEQQPAVGILHAAKNKAADLIALATHGRHGLSRMFLGSVADKVVRGSTIPVLVHKPVPK